MGDCLFGVSSIESFKVTPLITIIPKLTFNYCNNLRVFEVPENSELKTIEGFAFRESTIEEITIPSKFVEFNEDWCSFTGNIKKIRVLPNNPLFQSYEDKFILGKSSPEIDIFDVLVFAVQNIKFAYIFTWIKIIAISCFNGCNDLQKIEIQFNSNLKIIDRNAFAYSGLEEIQIPSSLTTINKFAFYNCNLLKKVVIRFDSELQSIDECAFSYSNISSFFVPPKVTMIHQYAFENCEKLQIFEIGDDTQIDFEKANFINTLNGFIMISANKRYQV